MVKRGEAYREISVQKCEQGFCGYGTKTGVMVPSVVEEPEAQIHPEVPHAAVGSRSGVRVPVSKQMHQSCRCCGNLSYPLINGVPGWSFAAVVKSVVTGIMGMGALLRGTLA